MFFFCEPSQVRGITIDTPTRQAQAAQPTRRNSSRYIWEFMSALAMCFSRRDAGDGVTSELVLSSGAESQMGWVRASRVIADDMVEFQRSATMSARDWLDEPCVQDAMGERIFALKPGLPITVSVERTSPIPASCCPVHLNLREDARERLGLEMWDREILNVSHARVLLCRVREWLGSGQRLRACPTRSLYTVLVAA